jgi:uncharacterized protein (TIGR02118 family)
MVKVWFCITRRPDLTPDQFREYWRDIHGPIAAKIPGLRHYVQHHSLHALPPGWDLPQYDGVAELWWDDYPAALAGLQSEETMAALADHPNFMDDHHKCAMFITEEVVIVEGRH